MQFLKRLRFTIPFFSFFFWCLLSAPVSAQTVTLSGRVLDAETGDALARANIVLMQAGAAGDRTTGRASDEQGYFTFKNLRPGTYTLVVSYIGYTRERVEKIRIQAGAPRDIVIRLKPTGIRLNPISITASRRPEKINEAPAAVSVVEAREIEARPALTVTDHLKGLPGVDIMQSGLATADIAVRGFNNVFAGSLLLLTDNRIARVPSLRLNVYSLIPASNDDIERIEVVSGPGSALYGPNSANGVLHILTKSPFESEGTTVSVGGGQRSVVMSALRHAQTIGKNIGLKISAQYFKGENWEFFDEAEPDSIIRGRQTANGRINEGGPILNKKDFTIDKYAVDARLDIKLAEDATLIFNSAVNTIDEIVVTPIGSASSNGWKYTYFQTRLKYKNLFAQIFTNRNDAGDTYFFRSGDVIYDKSRLYVGQIQHFLPVGHHQNFTYGFDALLTRPDTRNTINGSNEDIDDIDEYGFYVQSETRLSEKLKFIGAARLDQHNKIDNLIFSPRAALVFNTRKGHSFRLTYNKAFGTPTANDLFLDILTTSDVFTLGSELNEVYNFNAGTNIRAMGVPESGFHFRVNADGPQFRSPFAPLDPRNLRPTDFIDFNDATFTNTMWTAARKILIEGFKENLLAQGEVPSVIVNSLMQDFDKNIVPKSVSRVKNRLMQIDLETQSFKPASGVRDIPRLQPTITQTFELGYKGVMHKNLAVSVDLYYSRINNFISPLLIETPNVFLDPATLRASIAGEIERNYATSTNFLLKSILGQLDAQENGGNGDGSPVDELVTLFADSAAVIPLGTVTPQEAVDPTALILTFRNFGEISLYGADLSFEYFFNPSWSFGGTYSYVNRNLFELADEQVGAIPLNAPKHKIGFNANYINRHLGIVAGIRGRYVDGFPFVSGELVGDVKTYAVFDLNVEGHLSERMRVSLSVTNLLNNKHRELVGAPEIGRLAILRLTRTL